MQQNTDNIAKMAYVIVLLSVLVWFTAIILPAFWQSQGNLVAAFVLRKIFAPFCHQKVERAFFLWDYPLAVCARCTGIYLGVVLGSVIYPLIRDYRRSDVPATKYLIMALSPTTIDFLLKIFHIWENTHLSRAITGIIAGIAIAFYVVPAIVSLSLDLSKVFGKNKGVFYGSK